MVLVLEKGIKDTSIEKGYTTCQVHMSLKKYHLM